MSSRQHQHLTETNNNNNNFSNDKIMSEDGKLPEIASASNQPQPGDMENGGQPGMDGRDIQSANSFNQRGSRS